MEFGKAIELLKEGKRVQRSGWNGKGMWLKYVSPDHLMIAEEFDPDGAIDSVAGWIGIRTPIAEFHPWNASQADALAEDWQEFD